MIRVTRWSPDTCGCVLEYEWDDTKSENERIHSYVRTLKCCPEHEQLGLVAGRLYDQVLSENTRKNIAFDEIQKVKPEVTFDNYLWFFDKKRVLQISLIGVDLPPAAKQGLQTALDAEFGGGKVKVF